jgi:hypothetical protein
MSIMFSIVIEGHDETGIPTQTRVGMYFNSPPLVGDYVDLHTGEHQVTSRRWTKAGELEVHMMLVS